jgi:hypothetical protein
MGRPGHRAVPSPATDCSSRRSFVGRTRSRSSRRARSRSTRRPPTPARPRASRRKQGRCAGKGIRIIRRDGASHAQGELDRGEHARERQRQHEPARAGSPAEPGTDTDTDTGTVRRHRESSEAPIICAWPPRRRVTEVPIVALRRYFDLSVFILRFSSILVSIAQQFVVATMWDSRPRPTAPERVLVPETSGGPGPARRDRHHEFAGSLWV